MMKRAIKCIIFLFSFSLILVSDISYASNITYRLFNGVRPLGMGGAFIGVADDANAVYWNPAGFPYLEHWESNFMTRDLYDTGLKNQSINLVLPFREWVPPLIESHGLGFDFSSLSYDDEELMYSKNDVTISYGLQPRFFKPLSIGINLRYITTDTELDNMSTGFAKGEGDGLGIDCTALLRLPKDINIGVGMYDVGGTKIKYDTGNSKPILPGGLRIGLSCKPLSLLYDKEALKSKLLKNLGLAVDIDDRVHLGAECLYKGFGVRGGIQKDLHTDESLTYSVGGSVLLPLRAIQKNIQLHYACLSPPTLDPTHYLSISLSPQVSPVTIEKITIFEKIYPISYQYYHISKHPIGMVELKNKSEVDITVKGSFNVKGYTEDFIAVGTVKVPAKGSTEIPLIPKFTDKILEATKNKPDVPLIVKIEGEKDKKPFKDIKKETLFICSRYKIPWTYKPEHVSSVITPKDLPIKKFSDDIVSLISGKELVEKGILIPQNLYQAMVIYEALRYLDPKEIKGEYVKYPREVLKTLRGDCDDYTILYASLLQSLQIPVIIVDIPSEKHVLLMIGTGVHAKNAYIISPYPDKGLYEIEDDHVWIPIDVIALTDSNKSFFDAWIGGVTWLKDRDEGEIRKISIMKAKNEGYIPPDLDKIAEKDSSLKFSEEDATKLIPPEEKVKTKVIEDIGKFWMRHKKEFVKKIEEENDLLKKGILLSLKGELGSATLLFNKIIETNPGHAAAWNNLGNIHFLEGNIEEAMKCYQTATITSAKDGGIYLNMGIGYRKKEDESKSIEMFQNALEKYPTYYDAWVTLGLYRQWSKRDIRESSEGLIAKIVVEIKKLLKKAEAMVPKPPLPPEKTQPKFLIYGGVSRFEGYETNIPEKELLKNLLYWKKTAS